jgi:hypothetical protein
MKKFVKLSLVAAVAVAGLTTANAKPLEEAIKGVDVTGTVAYRYEEASKASNTAAGKEEQHNYYKAAMDMTVPAGDDLSMGLSFQAGMADLGHTAQGNGGGTGVDVQLTGANFTYTGLTNTSITAGLQAIPTPWTVAADAMGTTHKGTGILAVSTFAPVTLVGAYFNDTDIADLNTVNKSQDIAVVGAILNIAGVNAELMYADARDYLDSYTAALSYTLNLDAVKIGLSARYTNLEVDSATTDNDTTQGKITVAAGMFDAMVAYGENGSQGGLVAFDGTAKTTMEGWNVHLYGAGANAEYLKLSAGAKVLPSLHVSLNYNQLDVTAANSDEEETYVQVKYQASKSLSTYVRLGQVEQGNLDSDAGRLHIQYSF